MPELPQPVPQETIAIPDVLPVLPLRNTVVYPHAVVPIVVSQGRSVRLVEDAMRANRLVALVAQRTETIDPARTDQIYRVGTAAIIRQLTRAADGNLHLIVQGVERVRLLDFAALPIEAFQFACKARCFRPVLRQQKLERDRGIIGASGGIEPRSKAEGDHIRRGTSLGVTGALQQGNNPRPVAFHQRLKPVSNKNPVFAEQRHHVRHRTQGNQIELRHEEGLRLSFR
mgnify:CR=1 FL=1